MQVELVIQEVILFWHDLEVSAALRNISAE